MGPKRKFGDFLGFDYETGKFIFALGANAGKLTYVTCTSLSMGSICWPSLENEGREDLGMMKNISHDNWTPAVNRQPGFPPRRLAKALLSLTINIL